MSDLYNDQWYQYHYEAAYEIAKKGGASDEEAKKDAIEYVNLLYEADQEGDFTYATDKGDED